jgi:hypothetical protein
METSSTVEGGCGDTVMTRSGQRKWSRVGVLVLLYVTTRSWSGSVSTELSTIAPQPSPYGYWTDLSYRQAIMICTVGLGISWTAAEVRDGEFIIGVYG